MTQNVSNRLQLLKDPAQVVDVFSPDDLPALAMAPDGVMRSPLALSTKYIFHTDLMVLPRLLIPTASTPASAEVTAFAGARFGINILCLGDDTPHIWGRDIPIFSVSTMSLVGVGRVTNLYDLVGIGPQSFLSIINSAVIGMKKTGSLVDVSMNFDTATLFDMESGFVARAALSPSGLTHVLSGVRILQAAGAAAMEKPAVCFQGDPPTSSIGVGIVALNAGDEAFCIDSAAGGRFDFTGTSYQGVAGGEFFEQPIAAALTAMADVSKAITAFADSAVNPGVDTTVSVAAHGLTRGQTILIAGAGAPYDGTHTVVRVAADEQSFDINVTFTATTTGTLALTRVTSVSHGLVENQTTTISGTTSYNGTFRLVFVTNDTFDIPVAFVADDAAGTAAATSLDETIPGVGSTANGAQADSAAVGGANVNGSVTGTTIALADTYQAVALSGAVAPANEERFTLTTPATGLVTFNGLRPFKGTVTAFVTATKTGPTEQYRFQVSKNGAIPAGASTPYAPIEIKTDQETASLKFAIDMVTGDTFQLMVSGVGTTDSLTITDLIMLAC